MSKSRLELFSDAVIAIIITITVLELRAPEGSALADLGRLWPTFATYALSTPPADTPSTTAPDP